MADIFLSYNREDQAKAQLFAQSFEALGFSVWWDATLRSGEAYDEVTEEALRTAKAVVVLWSPRSVVSRWVRAEATIADRNKTLMPVTIEPCERPVMFELTQTADLSQWRGDTDDKSWRAFIDDVWRMVGRGAPDRVASAPAPASPPAGTGIPIVAVLPISHRDGAGEIAFFAEDLTEEITRALARSSYFNVIAASTLAVWRGKPIDNRTLKQELGARYIVEGKLQRGVDIVRLTMQLIDTATGRVLWSARMTPKLVELEVSPDEFAVSVASEVGEQIIQIEVRAAMSTPGPVSAWQHILRFMAHAGSIDADGFHKAVEEARQAVAAAPDFALAHAFLSAGIAALVSSGSIELDDALSREIQNHAKRALQLDGNNPVVITAVAVPYGVIGQPENGLRLALRGVLLNPYSPRPHFVLGLAYMKLGRIAEAIAAFEQQDRLTSIDSARSNGLGLLGICHALEGRPADAEEAFNRSLALSPDIPIGLKWQAIVAAQLGRQVLALKIIRQLRALEPNISIEQHVRQMLQHKELTERSTDAVATLRRLWDATEEDG